MTTVNIPNRPAGSAVRNIEAILADFDAITATINGNLDGANIHSRYGALLTAPGVATCTLKSTVSSQGTIGAGAMNFPFTIPGAIAFPSTCVAAWVGGYRVYTGAPQGTEVGVHNASLQAFPTGNTVQLNVSNFSGTTIYPYVSVYAIGY